MSGLQGLAEPIRRHSVAESVAQRILGLIKSGSLKPGDQLPTERDLAASLQVSRPSVREALRGLAILGVVKTRQGGGAYISALDAVTLLEPLQFFITLDAGNVDALYDARLLVETGIARRAAQRMGDEELAQLRALVEPHAKLATDPVGFRVADDAFHAMLWAGADNPFLARVALSLNVLGMDFRRRASELPSVLSQSAEDHMAIVAALESRDADRAAAAVATHMHNVHRTTIDAMQGAQ